MMKWPARLARMALAWLRCVNPNPHPNAQHEALRSHSDQTLKSNKVTIKEQRTLSASKGEMFKSLETGPSEEDSHRCSPRSRSLSSRSWKPSTEPKPTRMKMDPKSGPYHMTPHACVSTVVSARRSHSVLVGCSTDSACSIMTYEVAKVTESCTQHRWDHCTKAGEGTLRHSSPRNALSIFYQAFFTLIMDIYYIAAIVVTLVVIAVSFHIILRFSPASRPEPPNAREPDQDTSGSENESEDGRSGRGMRARGAAIGKKKARRIREKQLRAEYRQALEREREEQREKEAEEEEKRRDEMKRERERERQEAAALRKKRDERLKVEEEAYQALKADLTIEDEGTEAATSIDDKLLELVHSRPLLTHVEELAAVLNVRTIAIVDTLRRLESEGKIVGVLDERGQYVRLSTALREVVAGHIEQHGRVSLASLRRVCERALGEEEAEKTQPSLLTEDPRDNEVVQ